MGKSAKGKSKRRKNASEAAKLRWDREKAPPPPKKKPKKER